MKLLSLIFALAGSGAAAFLQPNQSPQLQHNLKHEKQNNIDFVNGEEPSKSSSLQMVAIRSPFWHAFDSKDQAVSSGSDEFVVDRDFSVATILMVVGIWLTCFGPSNYPEVDMIGGIFHIWFGAFIGKQTMKTRAVFTKDSFELRTVTNKHLGLQADKGLAPKERKNYVLGTDNKWKYSSFVNWDFFPSVDLPILVYFKETQTPKEMQIKGSLGARQMDRRDNGQMHFFPAYANAKQLREQFESHRCQKIGPVHGEEFKKK
ncbi:hypothetical protein ACHAWT_009422 [Skeletonema menzelii]